MRCRWTRLDVAEGQRVCSAEGDPFCARHAADAIAEARLLRIADAEREVMRWVRVDEARGMDTAGWADVLGWVSPAARCARILGAPTTDSAAIAVVELMRAMRPLQRPAREAAA
jgi:hypothetical protein